MKIISWNCNMRFRTKCLNLLNYNSDILIIQECENPEEVEYPIEFKQRMHFHLWIGSNKNKGLGIFSRYKLKVNDWKSNEAKYFISCIVNGDFNIIGVWCQTCTISELKYMGQFWMYLEENIDNIKKKDILLLGDFNSFKGFTKENKPHHHVNVIKKLKSIGIESLYHLYNNIDQGDEMVPTIYHMKNINKKYHVDYVFGSEGFYSKLSKFDIGVFEEWIKESDHMPIFTEFRS